MRTAQMAVLVGFLAIGAPAFSQDRNRSTYRVDFIIRDGNPAGAKAGRRFTMLVDADGKNSIHINHKVPYATGSTQLAQGGGAAFANTQLQYFDAGVDIDCRLHEVNTRLTMAAEFGVSTLVSADKNVPGSVPNPTVASVHMSLNTVLDPGKSAVIATIDDPATQRKFEIEATATRIN